MPVVNKDATFTPAEIVVYVEVAYYPSCGFKPSEKFVARIGTARDEAGAHDVIRKDREAMGDTLGGLIAPTSTRGRSYLAFRAGGWEPVPL